MDIDSNMIINTDMINENKNLKEIKDELADAYYTGPSIVNI